MLIVFKSKAAGDVMMFGDVAHTLMEIMGKDPGEKGIVTVEQLPGAIARLKASVAQDKAERPVVDHDEPMMVSDVGRTTSGSSRKPPRAASASTSAWRAEPCR